MTTYAELVTQIRDYTETDNQVLTDTIINDFIEHSEHRIFRDIELNNDNVYVNGNTASGNRFVRLPGFSSTDPSKPEISDIATIRYVTLYTDTAPRTRFDLVRVDQDFLAEYYDTPEVASTAKPRYYANWDMGTIVVAPTPNAVYKFEIGITKKPTGLSSSNTETWVSVNAPRVLLYACLCEAFKFLKAPQDQQVYEASYREAISQLAQEQLGKKRRDEFRDGSIRIPIPSANP
jgi:hypothetical protein|tara:strand:+ start:830 stop:1531 length:702 start_codon:yes stop_codon:yes gene_type:complete